MGFLAHLFGFDEPPHDSDAQPHNDTPDHIGNSPQAAVASAIKPAAGEARPQIKDGSMQVPPIDGVTKLPPGWVGKVPPELVADIPQSLLATAPKELTDQETLNLQQIQDLEGAPAKNPVAQYIEHIALFDGAVRMPTSNDAHGHPLGIEGCSKTILQRVLAQAATKFPSVRLPDMNSAVAENGRAFVAWLHQHPGIADTYDLKISMSTGYSFKPGDVVVAHKGRDIHMFVAARVPKSWNWPPDALMFVANTGLSHDSRGDNLGPPAMILSQEYIRNSVVPEETQYNNHGPINGPGTYKERNPYFDPTGKSIFTIIRFRNPDGTPSADGPPSSPYLPAPVIASR